MSQLQDRIGQIIQHSIQTKQALLEQPELLVTIQDVADRCMATYQQQGKLLFCGNGGSAADAQHIAAELSGRFYYDRPPLFAEALHVNTSFLTAVANDYGFEHVYERMIQAAGQRGDVLFALSTSGNSPNIIAAAKAAREQGLLVVGLTGTSGGVLKEWCDHLINIPSTDTPRIQESHILVGHIICELVEAALFPKKRD